MKIKVFVVFLIFTILLTACKSATPLPPITTTTGNTFTLGIDQTATITDAGFTIKLISVTGDQRCPLGMECAMSGPVSFGISVQKGSNTPVEFAMQTFTGGDGSAPDFAFEGIKSSVEFDGSIIQTKAVLPYPDHYPNNIESSEYRISLVVNTK